MKLLHLWGLYCHQLTVTSPPPQLPRQRQSWSFTSKSLTDIIRSRRGLSPKSAPLISYLCSHSTHSDRLRQSQHSEKEMKKFGICWNFQLPGTDFYVTTKVFIWWTASHLHLQHYNLILSVQLDQQKQQRNTWLYCWFWYFYKVLDQCNSCTKNHRPLSAIKSVIWSASQFTGIWVRSECCLSSTFSFHHLDQSDSRRKRESQSNISFPNQGSIFIPVWVWWIAQYISICHTISLLSAVET